jgi:hypothetical protein
VLLHGAACCASCGEEVRAVADFCAAGTLSREGLLTEAEVLLAFFRREAPALAAELAGMNPQEALGAVKEEERFASWGLAEQLCAASLEAAREDADRALALADLALAVAERAQLPDLTEDCRQELLMLAHAHRGNALRVAEELRFAAAELALAEQCWARAEARWFPYRAEVLSLRMSLERYQRHYGDCLDTAAEALTETRHRPALDKAVAVRILLKKAITLGEMGRGTEAVAAAREALAQVDQEKAPRLWLAAAQTEIFYLPGLGRYQEAESVLPFVAEQARRCGTASDRLRVDWAEARVRAGTGRMDVAVALMRRVRQGFLEIDQAPTAAVASLELATLYFELGQLHKVRSLALEMLPVFQEKGIHREALAALAIFQQAAITETVTEGLLGELVAYFRKAQSNPTLRFRPLG